MVVVKKLLPMAVGFCWKISKKLEEIGADWLAIAYAEEGVTLRNSGVMLPNFSLTFSNGEFSYNYWNRCFRTRHVFPKNFKGILS